MAVTLTIDKNEINKLISNNPEMFGLMDCNVLGKYVFEHIGKSQNIHTFGLHSCNGLCDGDLKCVGLLKKLRQLYFCNMPFTGKCLDYFEKCPHLTVLHWIFIKTKYYSWLSRLPYLKTLLLYHSDVTGDILPHLGRCQNLKTVDISCGNL